MIWKAATLALKSRQLPVAAWESVLPESVLALHVAQLVERWTPGSESAGSRRSGARYMKLLTHDWDGPVGGSSRGQLKPVEWDGPCPALMGT